MRTRQRRELDSRPARRRIRVLPWPRRPPGLSTSVPSGRPPGRYTEKMSCAICGKRRPRRYCPGVRGEICPVCCGTEREVTVRCPSDCEYLQAARMHEVTPPVDPTSLPHSDLRFDEDFVDQHADLIAALGSTLAAAGASAGAVDSDAREALAGLVKSYRTLASGVIFEAVPQNPIAAGLYRALKEAASRFQDQEAQSMGLRRTRDNDVLRALAFLDILALERSNGRRFGRAFLDALSRLQPPGGDEGPLVEPGSPLILP